MEPRLIQIAQACSSAAYDGTMNFPTIVRTLGDAGFEGYEVDYRGKTARYYLRSGACVQVAMPETDASIAAEFSAEAVAEAVREAQTQAPGYTYAGFCSKVKQAGCAGYIVSFLGKRVVYFGRTAELHVEHFPS